MNIFQKGCKGENLPFISRSLHLKNLLAVLVGPLRETGIILNIFLTEGFLIISRAQVWNLLEPVFISRHQIAAL
jgi:hypothetical protein